MASRFDYDFRSGPEMYTHVPLPPSLNTFYRYDRGQVHKRKAAFDYQEMVRAANWTGRPPLAGDLWIEARFRYPDRRRRDLDNYLKVLIDALTGIFWDDDCQIRQILAWEDDELSPPDGRVDIWVYGRHEDNKHE